MSAIKNLTDEQKISLLEQYGHSVSGNLSPHELDREFKQWLREEQTPAESPCTITIASLTPESSHVITTDEDIKKTKDHIKNALKHVLVESAVGIGGAVILGASLTPPGLAIIVTSAVATELLMRISTRAGSLFRGGSGIALQLMMQNLIRLNLDPDKVAQGVMAVATTFVKEPHKAIISIEGAASKFFSAFSKEMSTLAEKAGFHFAKTEHSSDHAIKTDETASSYHTPKPFSMELTPKGITE